MRKYLEGDFFPSRLLLISCFLLFYPLAPPLPAPTPSPPFPVNVNKVFLRDCATFRKMWSNEENVLETTHIAYIVSLEVADLSA